MLPVKTSPVTSQWIGIALSVNLCFKSQGHKTLMIGEDASACLVSESQRVPKWLSNIDVYLTGIWQSWRCDCTYLPRIWMHHWKMTAREP